MKELAALGSAVIGGIIQNNNIDRQIEAQQLENDKARRYNEKMLDKQNRFSVDMWRMNNDYNSPSAQMSRLKAAGLNPNLAYGSNFQATAPLGGTPQPSPVTDMSALGNKSNFSNAVTSALQAQLVEAQINNINADTKKKGSETNILDSDAKFRDAYNQGLLDTQNVQIKLSGSNMELNDANISVLRKKVSEIDANIEVLQKSATKIAAEALSVNTNTKLLEKNIQWFDREASARISQLIASANLSSSEASMVRNSLDEAVATFKTRAGLMQSQHRGQYLSNQQSANTLDRMNFELQMDKDFAKTERVMNVIGQGVGIITDVVSAFSPLKMQARQHTMNVGIEELRHNHRISEATHKHRLGRTR